MATPPPAPASFNNADSGVSHCQAFYGAPYGVASSYTARPPSTTPTTASPTARPSTAPHGQAFYGAPYGVASSYTAPPASAHTWDPSALAQPFTNMTLQPPTPEWVMDSGATAHLSNNPGILSSLSSHPPYRHVTVGDGSSVSVSASGHASLPSSFSDRSLHLRNVLVTPRIIKNLVSVRQFTTDNNCSVNFDPFGFFVKDSLPGVSFFGAKAREALFVSATGASRSHHHHHPS